jgi:hypothetical protein
MTHPSPCSRKLEYDLLLENRRWPSGKFKIARSSTLATVRNGKNPAIRGELSFGGAAWPPIVCHKVLNWLTYLNDCDGMSTPGRDAHFDRMQHVDDDGYAGKSKSFVALSL